MSFTYFDDNIGSFLYNRMHYYLEMTDLFYWIILVWIIEIIRIFTLYLIIQIIAIRYEYASSCIHLMIMKLVGCF